jgi:hypothetical protein
MCNVVPACIVQSIHTMHLHARDASKLCCERMHGLEKIRAATETSTFIGIMLMHGYHRASHRGALAFERTTCSVMPLMERPSTRYCRKK